MKLISFKKDDKIQIVIENSGGEIFFRIPPNTVKNVIDEAILEQVAEAAKKPERVAGVATKPGR